MACLLRGAALGGDAPAHVENACRAEQVRGSAGGEADGKRPLGCDLHPEPVAARGRALMLLLVLIMWWYV